MSSKKEKRGVTRSRNESTKKERWLILGRNSDQKFQRRSKKNQSLGGGEGGKRLQNFF